MHSETLPNPFALTGETPWPPALQRSECVFGAPVELVLLPERRSRGGAPGAARAPFRGDVARLIVEREALWRAPGVVLTPNRFPFARRHAILWADTGTREATPALLEMALALVEQHGGTVLGNSIGAAASIARAHVHIVSDRLPFLASLDVEATDIGRALPGDTEVVCARALAALGVRGSSRDRARAAHRLLELRMTASINLVDDGTTTWIAPRTVETPVPHFPHALGAAELWGRWCYGDETALRTAGRTDLERALELALARRAVLASVTAANLR